MGVLDPVAVELKDAIDGDGGSRGVGIAGRGERRAGVGR